MTKPNNITEFLRESNAIEFVYDEQSLVDAQKAWKYLSGVKKLTVSSILKTHAILMEHQDISDKDKGNFRTQPVWIGNGEAKPWWTVPELMDSWIANANDVVINGQNENPIYLERIIKEHHVNFEAIHPFCDGNGREGRLLFSWERIRVGLPILVILEAEKYKYYDWFRAS